MASLASLTFSLDQPQIKALDWMLNLAGYTPMVSSFSGWGRMAYGVVRVIVGIAGLIFTSHAIMAQLAISGVYHFARGYVEMIPFIGNAACFAFDILRLFA